MNTLDYSRLLKEIMDELTEQGGTFKRMFGEKTDKEIEEMRYIAAVALVAADRYYSMLTRMDYALRSQDEVHSPKKSDE